MASRPSSAPPSLPVAWAASASTRGNGRDGSLPATPKQAPATENPSGSHRSASTRVLHAGLSPSWWATPVQRRSSAAATADLERVTNALDAKLERMSVGSPHRRRNTSVTSDDGALVSAFAAPPAPASDTARAPATPEGRVVSSLLRAASSTTSSAASSTRGPAASPPASPSRARSSSSPPPASPSVQRSQKVLADAEALADAHAAAMAARAARLVADPPPACHSAPPQLPARLPIPDPVLHAPSGTTHAAAAPAATASHWEHRVAQWRQQYAPQSSSVAPPPAPDAAQSGRVTDVASTAGHREPNVTAGTSFASPLMGGAKAREPLIGVGTGDGLRRFPVASSAPPSGPAPQLPAAAAAGTTLSFADANRIVEARRLWRESQSLCPAPLPRAPAAAPAGTADSQQPASSPSSQWPGNVTVTVNVPQQQAARRLGRRRRAASAAAPASKPAAAPKARRKGVLRQARRKAQQQQQQQQHATPCKGTRVAFGSGRSRSNEPRTTSTSSRAAPRPSVPRQPKAKRRVAVAPTAAEPPQPPAAATASPVPGVASVHVIPSAGFVADDAAAVGEGVETEPAIAAAAAASRSCTPASTDGNPRHRDATPVCDRAVRAARPPSTTAAPSRPCVGCAARDRKLEAVKAAADTKYHQQLARHRKELKACEKQWRTRLETATSELRAEVEDAVRKQDDAAAVHDAANRELEATTAQQVSQLRGLLKEETARLQRARLTIEQLTAENGRLRARPTELKSAVVDHAEYDRVVQNLVVAEEGRAEAEAKVITLTDKLQLEAAETNVVASQLASHRNDVAAAQRALSAAEARAAAAEAHVAQQQQEVEKSAAAVTAAAQHSLDLQRKVEMLEKLVFGPQRPRKASRPKPPKVKHTTKPNATQSVKMKPPLPTAAVRHARRRRRTASRGRGGGRGRAPPSPAGSVSTIGFVTDSSDDEAATAMATEAERGMAGMYRAGVSRMDREALQRAAAIVRSSSVGAYSPARPPAGDGAAPTPEPRPPLRKSKHAARAPKVPSSSFAASEPSVDPVPPPALTRWFVAP